MVQVDLITGFLGAGKTTFLRRYAAYLVAQGHNVCILENDFGAVNVDAMLVQDLLGDHCEIETISGGFLVQERDIHHLDPAELKVVTETQPDPALLDDLVFAWNVVKHVKSNAIVVAKDGVSIGVGAGQMNRVGSCDIALKHAGDKAKGAVLASDAFFPFADNIEVAAAAGITAIIQPGGSIRDQEVIDACNKFGIAMVFTGVRHFKH